MMDKFLRAQLRHHPEVAPHIKLFLFEHRGSRVYVSALKQKAEAESKTTIQMENT